MAAFPAPDRMPPLRDLLPSSARARRGLNYVVAHSRAVIDHVINSLELASRWPTKPVVPSQRIKKDGGATGGFIKC